MKKYFISLIVGLCFIVCGALISFYEALDFRVVDKFVNDNFSEKTITYDLKNTNDLVIINTPFISNTSIEYDNTIPSGNYRITIKYYNEILDIDKYSEVEDKTEYVNIDMDSREDFDNLKKLINVTIDGLRDKKVYNYSKALSPTIKVYINASDKDKIESYYNK
jgi:hypothetical protein